MTDVWAAVTEPDRLERWIGTWAGDPASGTVQFRMTAEGEDIEAEPMTVHECDPPRRLVLSWMSGATSSRWHVELDLAEAGGVTTLTFAQRVPDTATGRDVGPGWEYYLDRLTAAESGGDVAAVAWPDYEGMAGHYEGSSPTSGEPQAGSSVRSTCSVMACRARRPSGVGSSG